MDFKELMKNKNFIILTLVFTLVYSVYTCLATVISPISKPFGFKSSDASIMGASFVLSGVFGSFLISVLLDKYKCFLKAVRFICFGSLISAVGIYFTLKSGNLVFACLNIGALGLCLLPICSVGYSFCTEITYPISEPMSNGIMTFVS
jgi:cyanate permease